MILVVMMAVAAVALVWEKFGQSEALATALGLAFVFSLAEAFD